MGAGVSSSWSGLTSALPYTVAVDEKMKFFTPPFTAASINARVFTVLLR
jgi:hypothetical protein